MSYDYAREIAEARDFDDEIDTGDVDDAPDARPQYRCSDGFCGATDCSRCYPGWLLS